ncbi:hypothetical protein HY995_01325 [Candidatus Micrarchaeota archaeon]|nr:hypothetical protein [Candidatus Micrarchaeota archaeon]MBI5176708.1 hypothetical protein [Candidatus Micrarchaeota archaeon]
MNEKTAGKARMTRRRFVAGAVGAAALAASSAYYLRNSRHTDFSIPPTRGEADAWMRQIHGEIESARTPEKAMQAVLKLGGPHYAFKREFLSRLAGEDNSPANRLRQWRYGPENPRVKEERAIREMDELCDYTYALRELGDRKLFLSMIRSTLHSPHRSVRNGAYLPIRVVLTGADRVSKPSRKPHSAPLVKEVLSLLNENGRETVLKMRNDLAEQQKTLGNSTPLETHEAVDNIRQILTALK